MKAVVITRYGGPEVLEVQDTADPQPKAGQAMVRVQAAGVNFADIMMANGGYPNTPPPPLVAGREFAGVLEESGERVMGYTSMSGFAERVAIPRTHIWPIPDRWSPEEGAAFPVNFFTAYFAYWSAGLLDDEKPRGLRPRVLIHAVAGGVGTAAIEIGKVLGVELYGTSSADDKLERCRELGLDHGINYKAHDYEERIQELTKGEGVDAVFEMLGGEHTAKSIRCVGFRGRVVIYGSATGKQPQLDVRALYSRAASVHGLWLTFLSQRQDMMVPAWQRLSRWIADGKVHPIVGHTLPMARAGDAFRLMLERKNFGKIVLKW